MSKKEHKCPPPLSPMQWQASAEILDGLPVSSMHAWVTPSVFATIKPQSRNGIGGVWFEVKLTNKETGLEHHIASTCSVFVDAEQAIRSHIVSADSLVAVLGSERP